MKSEAQLQLPNELARGLIRAANETKPIYAVDTAATAAITERAVFQFAQNSTVLRLYFLASTANTATGATSCHTLTVTKYNGSSATGTAMASATVSAATPTAAMQVFDLGALTGAACVAGSVLSFAASLTGTSTLPTGRLMIDYTTD